VTGTITITTLLFFYIARTRWGTPLWLVVLGAGASAPSRRVGVSSWAASQPRPLTDTLPRQQKAAN
jgi:hypothetical protein